MDWFYDEHGNKFATKEKIGNNIMCGKLANFIIEDRGKDKDFEEWVSATKKALSDGKPEIVFAGTVMTADEVKLVDKICYSDNHIIFPVPYDDIDVWKITHSKLNYYQMMICLVGLTHGLKIIDKVENVRKYRPTILWWLLFAYAGGYGEDLCHLLNPKMDEEAFIEQIKTKYKERAQRDIFTKELLSHYNIVSIN